MRSACNDLPPFVSAFMPDIGKGTGTFILRLFARVFRYPVLSPVCNLYDLEDLPSHDLTSFVNFRLRPTYNPELPSTYFDTANKLISQQSMSESSHV